MRHVQQNKESKFRVTSPFICTPIDHGQRPITTRVAFTRPPSPIKRPLPSSENPHFQNEAKCTTFLVKMSFICMKMHEKSLRHSEASFKTSRGKMHFDHHCYVVAYFQSAFSALVISPSVYQPSQTP